MREQSGRAAGQFAGPGLVLGSMASIELGAAATVLLSSVSGSFGMTALRLACAAVIMLVWARPRVWRFDARQWISALGLGLATAVNMMAYFESVTLIPLGAATTIDVLGPLAIAVIALKGWARVALPLLAALGVVAITTGPGGWLLDPLGVMFALVAAGGWAAYIVLARRVGRLFSKQEGLALSLGVAAALALPVAILRAPTDLSLAHVPAAAGLALLMPIIPFTFEMIALRRMDMGTFSILLSLEPAIGAILGFVVLGQILSPQQMLGCLAVVIAGSASVGLSTFYARHLKSAQTIRHDGLECCRP